MLHFSVAKSKYAAAQMGQTILTYFFMGGMTVWLASCLTRLGLTREMEYIESASVTFFTQAKSEHQKCIL